MFHDLDTVHVVMHGTSMAAPHVAGVAALILQACPSLPRQDIINLIVTHTNNGHLDAQAIFNNLVCGCCNGDGVRGNADGITGPAGEYDVADLTLLVNYLFQGGPAPPCEEEGNVDGQTGPAGPIDVADMTYLVAALFTGGPPPPACP